MYRETLQTLLCINVLIYSTLSLHIASDSYRRPIQLEIRNSNLNANSNNNIRHHSYIDDENKNRQHNENIDDDGGIDISSLPYENDDGDFGRSGLSIIPHHYPPPQLISSGVLSSSSSSSSSNYRNHPYHHKQQQMYQQQMINPSDEHHFNMNSNHLINNGYNNQLINNNYHQLLPHHQYNINKNINSQGTDDNGNNNDGIIIGRFNSLPPLSTFQMNPHPQIFQHQQQLLLPENHNHHNLMMTKTHHQNRPTFKSYLLHKTVDNMNNDDDENDDGTKQRTNIDFDNPINNINIDKNQDDSDDLNISNNENDYHEDKTIRINDNRNAEPPKALQELFDESLFHHHHHHSQEKQQQQQQLHQNENIKNDRIDKSQKYHQNNDGIIRKSTLDIRLKQNQPQNDEIHKMMRQQQQQPENNNDLHSSKRSPIPVGAAAGGSGTSNIPIGDFIPQVTHSQLLLRSARGQRQYDVPQIECPPAIDGMERFACPTPDRQGRYRCIDDHVLCDGFIDCPEGEDEDRQACMFYKTTKAHLDVLADALLRWARGR